MYLRDTENEYGTPVSEFRCDTCLGVFTVCPLPPMDQRWMWNGCMSLTCDSYDINRDAEAILGFGWGALAVGGRVNP